MYAESHTKLNISETKNSLSMILTSLKFVTIAAFSAEKTVYGKIVSYHYNCFSI